MIQELAQYEKSAQGVAKTMDDLERRIKEDLERRIKEEKEMMPEERLGRSIQTAMQTRVGVTTSTIIGLFAIGIPLFAVGYDYGRSGREKKTQESAMVQQRSQHQKHQRTESEKKEEKVVAVYVAGIHDSIYQNQYGSSFNDGEICNKTLEIARKANILSNQARKSIYRIAVKRTHCTHDLVAIVAEANDIKDREIYTNALNIYQNFEADPAFVSDIVKIVKHAKNLPAEDRKIVSRLALQKVNTVWGIVDIVREAQDLNDEQIWKSALERIRDPESIKTILGWYNTRNGYEADAGAKRGQ